MVLIVACAAEALAQQGAIIIPRDSGKVLDLGLGRAAITVAASQTDGRFSQLELVEYPGYSTPLHIHDKSVETFFVLKGTLTLLLAGKKHEIAAGGSAVIPMGTPHAQGNFTKEDVHVLITLSPGGFEKFFEERAEIVKRYPEGTKEYGEQMRALGQRYDIRNIDYDPFKK